MSATTRTPATGGRAARRAGGCTDRWRRWTPICVGDRREALGRAAAPPLKPRTSSRPRTNAAANLSQSSTHGRRRRSGVSSGCDEHVDQRLAGKAQDLHERNQPEGELAPSAGPALRPAGLEACPCWLIRGHSGEDTATWNRSRGCCQREDDSYGTGGGDGSGHAIAEQLLRDNIVREINPMVVPQIDPRKFKESKYRRPLRLCGPLPHTVAGLFFRDGLDKRICMQHIATW